MKPNSIDQKFGKYVASSMVTMFLQSAYSIIDGLFVSNLINETALAAINVVWPIIAVVTALGTGIGCGGAVIMSTKQGEGREEASNLARANVIVALLAVSVVSTVCFMLCLTPLLKLMGAEGELLRLATIYGRIMIAGGTIQILSCGLTPLLRNDNRAVSAMVIMVCGLLVNLGLDYTLMAGFGMGIGGAAAASLCAQGFTALSCLAMLIGKKSNPLRLNQFKICACYWKRILKTAISPFGISLTPSLLILYHNVACLKTGNALAVSAYALISSTVGSYRILLIGVAEGIQPLASYANGAQDYEAMRRIRNRAIVTALTVSILLFLFTIATASYYPALYGYSDEAAVMGVHSVRVTAAQLIFTGLVRVTNSFFYAVGKDRYSLFMIYFDPIILTPLVIHVLPQLLGLDGIWLTAVVTQFLLNLVAAWMFFRHEKEIRQLEQEKQTQINLLSGQAGALD